MAIEQLIFTDCPRGKGIDPNASGLQIKACSEGLNQDLRWQLSNICMHHGQAFSISKAPHDAIEAEQEWLSKTSDRKAIPENLLDKFPVIWSYDKIQDDLFALTRIKYLCLTNDGRTGNFLAHAFVFNPEELALLNNNPLALSNSEIFASLNLNASNTLSQIPDFGITAKPLSNYNLLQNKIYQEHFPAMVSALNSAIQESRPILICLSNWRQSLNLIDLLLQTLPPKIRCQTTFCTYESDRNWRIPTAAGKPVKQQAVRSISVLYGIENRSFDLRADEYKSLFTVFNFVDNKFSELPAPNHYASFATECLIKGNLEKLSDYHGLLEKFGFENNVNNWDLLVPAVSLFDKQPKIENLKIAIESLIAITKNNQQAVIALEMLTSPIKSLALANNSKELISLSTDLATLVEFLPKEADTEQPHDYIKNIFDLANNTLINGQICTAVALINSSGKYHDELVLILFKKIFTKLQPDFIKTLAAIEKEELINLLLKYLPLLRERPDIQVPFNPVLALTFRIANEAGLMLKTWESIGEEMVVKLLDDKWDSEKQKLAEELANYITAENCPDASAWLKMKLLKMTKLQDEPLRKLLIDTAHACSKANISSELIKELLEITQEKYSDEEFRTIVLGQMAEVTRGTEHEKLLFSTYEKMIQKYEIKQQNKIFRELANSKVTYLLCRQLLDDVLPWIEDDGIKKIQRWYDVVLKHNPLVNQVLYSELTLKIQRSENFENILPFCEKLLIESKYRMIPDSYVSGLCDAIVFALPLEPLPQQWKRLFDSLSSIKLQSKTTQRLRILNFLEKIEQLAEEKDWSFEKFPDSDPIWQKEILSLMHNEKNMIFEWCLSKFKTCGVTAAAEVSKLINLLETLEMSSIDNIVTTIRQLIAGRDPVTCIITIAAFADYGLDYPKQIDLWGEIVSKILEQLDRDIRRLFKLYLKHRFHKPDQQYEENLESLLIAARLESPKPKDTVKGVVTTQGSLSTMVQHSKTTRILADISHQLLKAIGRVKGKTISSKSQKKRR